MVDSLIHPSAVINSRAKLAFNVRVGAYSIVGPNVEIGEGTVIYPHVVLDGHLKIGSNNVFYQFTSVGAPPQDMTYKGDNTEVHIGDHNILREYVSVHRGTIKGGKLTEVGSHNLLMAYTHVGHDVRIGDHCVVANSTNFAGHVKVGSYAVIGGGTNISQFVSIGRGSYIGGASAIDRDVPLFCTAYGNRVRLKGVNIIGMRRQGYDKQVITEVVDFYRDMEASPLSPTAFVNYEKRMFEYNKDNEIIKELSHCIRDSKIGIALFFTA